MYGLNGLQKGAKRIRLVLIVGSMLLVVLSLGVIGFMYWSKKSDAAGNDKRENAKITKRIIDKVSKLYILPNNEEPTVAEIQDKSKLPESSRQFFEKAQNGDYLLVYTKAKIALIYREDVNKLVNVGPVNTEEGDQDQAKQSGSEEQKPASSENQ